MGFTVDVGRPGVAKHPAKRAMGNRPGNRLTRESDVKDERVQFAARARVAAALLDQVLRERGAIGEHGEPLQASTFVDRGSTRSATSSSTPAMIQSGRSFASRPRSA